MKRLMILTALALAACGGDPKPDEQPVSVEPRMDGNVSLALTVANGIQANPATADSVLAANGLTRPGFDSLLYKIAADSALSAQYTAGRR